MTEREFISLEAFAERIEREVYRRSIDLMQLSEYGFTTRPEGDLSRASKRLKDTAAYIEKTLAEIEARRQGAA